jgi:UDP-glucose 4-epimerase
MRYLITGGAGFIGSHLADALIARGDEVTVLDDVSTGRIENIEHHLGGEVLTFHRGSVLDYPLVNRLVREADAVVHLAAAVGVELIVRHPLDSLLTNIRGTEIVLHAADRHATKVLLASTSEIYGKNGHGPLREDADRILGSPFKSRWAYSTSKAVDEILANAYWRERGTPTIVVRLFNCVGPRQTGAYGMVVPRLVQQALRGEVLTVYGTGEQRRSFCHVADTVRALVELVDHPLAIGEVFNVGAEREVSINDLARLVIRMAGSSSEVVHVPYEIAYEEGFEDMERRLPNISKVRTLTGWEPSRSLEEIVADVIAHERDKLPASLDPSPEGVIRPGA